MLSPDQRRVAARRGGRVRRKTSARSSLSCTPCEQQRKEGRPARRGGSRAAPFAHAPAERRRGTPLTARAGRGRGISASPGGGGRLSPRASPRSVGPAACAPPEAGIREGSPSASARSRRCETAVPGTACTIYCAGARSPHSGDHGDRIGQDPGGHPKCRRAPCGPRAGARALPLGLLAQAEAAWREGGRTSPMIGVSSL